MESAIVAAPSESAATWEGIRIHRIRVRGFTGAGVCFLISQIGLLWVLASGGIGAVPTVASVVWLLSSLGVVLFMLLISDSYREHPRWCVPARTD